MRTLIAGQKLLLEIVLHNLEQRNDEIYSVEGEEEEWHDNLEKINPIRRQIATLDELLEGSKSVVYVKTVHKCRECPNCHTTTYGGATVMKALCWDREKVRELTVTETETGIPAWCPLRVGVENSDE